MIMHVTAIQQALCCRVGTLKEGVSSGISPWNLNYSRIWLYSMFNIVSGIQRLYVAGYAIVKDGSFYQKANSKEKAFVALKEKSPKF